MSGFPVYVAAPYTRAAEVRALHDELHALGCQPVSHWARLAKGLDQCAEMSAGERLSCIELNDRNIEQAAAVLAITYEGEGGEMFCEVERAREAGCPVLWTGPRFILSCARQGIYLVTLERALQVFTRARRLFTNHAPIPVARMRLHRELRWGRAECVS